MKYHFQIRGIPNEQIICFSYENSEIRYVDRIKIELQKHLVSRKLLIKSQNKNVRNLKRIDNNCNLWHLHFTKHLFRLQLSHQFKWCRSLKDVCILHMLHQWQSYNDCQQIRETAVMRKIWDHAQFSLICFSFSRIVSPKKD